VANDYTTQKMIDRIGVKAMLSTSSALSTQQLVDLLNDSLRTYIVPFTAKLREEWWVGAVDIVAYTDANGMIVLPDTVAQSLRTVSWMNSGVLVPLSRVEPENSFGYLPFTSNVPTGFQIRGNTMQVLPKSQGIEVHITAMLRPPSMVLTENAALVSSFAGTVGATYTFNLSSVPLEWQSALPAQLDLISGVSPFVVPGTVTVASLVGSLLAVNVAGYPSVYPAVGTPSEQWFSDVGTSPLPSVPPELVSLLEQDVICALHAANGDRRLAGAEKRREQMETDLKAVMAPRTTGNARVIVNHSAPGMHAFAGLWPRR
jgi:hypothetical protein